MPSLMNDYGNNQKEDVNAILQRAMQNPAQFEQFVKTNNPQAYQQACQIRNSANPQMLIMQMVQQSGINPNVLRMLGII